MLSSTDLDRRVRESLRDRDALAAGKRLHARMVAGDFAAHEVNFVRHCDRRHFEINWLPRRDGVRDSWAIHPNNLATQHIRDVLTLTGAWHEKQHLENGRCPRTGAHVRTHVGVDHWACLECERLASDGVLRSGLPLSRPMLDELAYCLHTYRYIPATADAAQQAKEFCSPIHWARIRQRTVKGTL